MVDSDRSFVSLPASTAGTHAERSRFSSRSAHSTSARKASKSNSFLSRTRTTNSNGPYENGKFSLFGTIGSAISRVYEWIRPTEEPQTNEEEMEIGAEQADENTDNERTSNEAPVENEMNVEHSTEFPDQANTLFSNLAVPSEIQPECQSSPLPNPEPSSSITAYYAEISRILSDKKSHGVSLSQSEFNELQSLFAKCTKNPTLLEGLDSSALDLDRIPSIKKTIKAALKPFKKDLQPEGESVEKMLKKILVRELRKSLLSQPLQAIDEVEDKPFVAREEELQESEYKPVKRSSREEVRETGSIKRLRPNEFDSLIRAPGRSTYSAKFLDYEEETKVVEEFKKELSTIKLSKEQLKLEPFVFNVPPSSLSLLQDEKTKDSSKPASIQETLPVVSFDTLPLKATDVKQPIVEEAIVKSAQASFPSKPAFSFPFPSQSMSAVESKPFSFGEPTAAVSEDKAESKQPSVFKIESLQPQEYKTTFQFGAPPVQTAVEPKLEEQKPGFEFGGKKGEEQQSVFSFGKQEAETKSFTFGKQEAETKSFTFGKQEAETKSFTFGKQEAETKSLAFGKQEAETKSLAFGKQEAETKSLAFGKQEAETKSFTFGKQEGETKSLAFGESKPFAFGESKIPSEPKPFIFGEATVSIEPKPFAFGEAKSFSFQAPTETAPKGLQFSQQSAIEQKPFQFEAPKQAIETKSPVVFGEEKKTEQKPAFSFGGSVPSATFSFATQKPAVFGELESVQPDGKRKRGFETDDKLNEISPVEKKSAFQFPTQAAGFQPSTQTTAAFQSPPTFQFQQPPVNLFQGPGTAPPPANQFFKPPTTVDFSFGSATNPFAFGQPAAPTSPTTSSLPGGERKISIPKGFLNRTKRH